MSYCDPCREHNLRIEHIGMNTLSRQCSDTNKEHYLPTGILNLESLLPVTCMLGFSLDNCMCLIGTIMYLSHYIISTT